MVGRTLNEKIKEGLGFEPSQIIEFCQRWKVTELALFGSALRDDFREESDIDILISFAPDATWSLFDIVTMKYQLEDIFHREVDLIEEGGLVNPYRRKSILEEKEIIYAAS